MPFSPYMAVLKIAVSFSFFRVDVDSAAYLGPHAGVLWQIERHRFRFSREKGPGADVASGSGRSGATAGHPSEDQPRKAGM